MLIVKSLELLTVPAEVVTESLPVVAILGGVIFLGEQLTLLRVIATLIVLCGYLS